MNVCEVMLQLGTQDIRLWEAILSPSFTSEVQILCPYCLDQEHSLANLAIAIT